MALSPGIIYKDQSEKLLPWAYSRSDFQELLSGLNEDLFLFSFLRFCFFFSLFRSYVLIELGVGFLITI